MMYERVLLQTIKFDLQVEHPYPSLLKFGKALKGTVYDHISALARISLNNNISNDIIITLHAHGGAVASWLVRSIPD